MSRRSNAALSIVAPALDYAEPPAEFCAEAAALWRSVIRTKPIEWFGHDTYPLLSAYCQGAVDAKRAAARLQSFDTSTLNTDDKALGRYERLHRIVDAQRKTLGMLATKMRLAQQSRYDEKAAKTAAQKGSLAAAGSMPWEAQ